MKNPVNWRKHSELCMEPAKGLTALGTLGDLELPGRKGRRRVERREMSQSWPPHQLFLPFELLDKKGKFIHYLRLSLLEEGLF